MAEEHKLFTRKATGLVRSIGISTAVILALCNVVGLGWQKKIFQAAGWAPIGDSTYVLGVHPVVMAFLIAGAVILLSVYCFAVLSAAMPKSGGGYIFISRIMSPRLGFIATWLQFWAVAVSYGIVAVAVVEVVTLFGGRAGLSGDAQHFLETPWVMFGIGAVLMLVFSAVAAFGIKQTGRLLHAIFWVPVGVLVVVYILFITATPESMESGVVGIYGYASQVYTRAAIGAGMENIGLTIGYWGAVATAILAAYWAFIGYAAATFVAGEVKEAHKSLPKALFISGIAIVVLYMSVSMLMARAGMMVGKPEGKDHSLLTSVAFLNYGKLPDDPEPIAREKESFGNDDFEWAQAKLVQENEVVLFLHKDESLFAASGRKLAEEELIRLGPLSVPALDEVIGEAHAEAQDKPTDSQEARNFVRLRAVRDKVAAAPAGTPQDVAGMDPASLARMARDGLPKIGGWMPFMADIQAAGMGINWLMIVLVIFAALWVANDIPPFILTSSRMIFAMAFDGVLPKSLAKVNAKWHSPVNAVVFVSLVSLLGAAAEANIFGKDAPIISSGGVLTNTSMWDAIFFTFCALACVYFPIRKPGIFEKSPFRASKQVVILLGVLATAGNGILLAAMAIGKDGWNLLGLKSLSDAGTFIFSVCLIVAGLLIFEYFSRRSKRTGVELTTIFTEIPPD
jgi:amino acid transporter